MRLFYLIVNINDPNYTGILLSHFKDYNIKIISQELLCKLSDNYDLIFINKKCNPYKNKMQELNKLTNFCYLSNDKAIYFVSKNDYENSLIN